MREEKRDGQTQIDAKIDRHYKLAHIHGARHPDRHM